MAPDAGLNNINTVGEWNEVSREDEIRVSENARKAAMIWWQIRDDQQKNTQLAKFLEFLFGEVKHDGIWEMIIALCTIQDSSGRWLTLSLHEMIALFVPFFPHEVEQYGIEVVIEWLPHIAQVQIDTYSSYINALRKKYPLIHDMDTETLSKLSMTLLEYFGALQVLDAQRDETVQSIKGFITM